MIWNGIKFSSVARRSNSAKKLIVSSGGPSSSDENPKSSVTPSRSLSHARDQIQTLCHFIRIHQANVRHVAHSKTTHTGAGMDNNEAILMSAERKSVKDVSDLP